MSRNNSPWFLSLFRQNLVLEGECYPIILNTHFSQKVCMEIKAENAEGPKAAMAMEKCRPLPLTRCLWRSETSQVSTERSVPCKQVGQLFLSCDHGKQTQIPRRGTTAYVRFQLVVLEMCRWNGDSCRFRWLVSWLMRDVVFMHKYLV